MPSVRHAVCMTTALLLGVSTAFPQASSGAGDRKPTPEEDIRAIRQMMEEQALKIEAISQQVAKLSKAMSESQPAPVAKPVEEPAPAPAEASQPAPSTSGSNAVHIVAKGETLTSIARHSKVTVAELLKLNKIENDRALQIGQALILPTPKPQETPVANPPK